MTEVQVERDNAIWSTLLRSTSKLSAVSFALSSEPHALSEDDQRGLAYIVDEVKEELQGLNEDIEEAQRENAISVKYAFSPRFIQDFDYLAPSISLVNRAAENGDYEHVIKQMKALLECVEHEVDRKRAEYGPEKEEVAEEGAE